MDRETPDRKIMLAGSQKGTPATAFIIENLIFEEN